MCGRVSQRHRFDEGMHTEAGEDANGQAAVQWVGVAVLNADGDKVQGDLGEKAGEDEGADAQIVPGRGARLRVIQLRQEMKQSEAKQVSPGKSIEELDVP